MSRPCPQCQRQADSSLRGGLLTERCRACGWERCGTANSPDWFPPAVEVETDSWIRLRPPATLTAAQWRVLRALDPQGAGESVQSFVSRMRGAREMRLGPFWPRPRAWEALRTLAEAGLDASLDD
jgi:hypothetical protein